MTSLLYYFQLLILNIMGFGKRHKIVEKRFNKAAKGKKTLSLKHLASIVMAFAKHYKEGEILYQYGWSSRLGYSTYQTFKVMKETAKYVTLLAWNIHTDEQGLHFGNHSKSFRVKYCGRNHEYALFKRHYYVTREHVEEMSTHGYYVTPGEAGVVTFIYIE